MRGSPAALRRCWRQGTKRRHDAGRRAPAPAGRTSHCPPPHARGGAVELKPTTPEGQDLDFGSPFPAISRRSAATDVRGLTPTARATRHLLIAALAAVGFTNCPAEWWHWEYGTPGWALRT